VTNSSRGLPAEKRGADGGRITEIRRLDVHFQCSLRSARDLAGGGPWRSKSHVTLVVCRSASVPARMFNPLCSTWAVWRMHRLLTPCGGHRTVRNRRFLVMSLRRRFLIRAFKRPLRCSHPRSCRKGVVSFCMRTLIDKVNSCPNFGYGISDLGDRKKACPPDMSHPAKKYLVPPRGGDDPRSAHERTTSVSGTVLAILSMLAGEFVHGTSRC